MLSTHVSVMSFLRESIGLEKTQKRNGHVAKRTTRWRVEKEKFLLEQEQLTLKTILKSRSSQISHGLGSVCDLIVKRLTDERCSESISARDLKQYWDMLREISLLMNENEISEKRSGEDVLNGLLSKMKKHG